MRILFINKYDIHGGAAIFAYKLGKSLAETFNSTNRFLVGIKKSSNEIVLQLRRNSFEIEIERGLNFLFSSVGMQYFYFPLSTKRILKYVNDFRPDIISLHNSHGGYFKTSLLETLSQKCPLVWSLHDMWSITGSAAYTFGNESWKNMKTFPGESKIYPYLGFNSNEYLMKFKKRIYDRSNLTIVTASNWMNKNVKDSPLLKSKEIVNIPYGIDLQLYNDKDKELRKERFGIPASEIVIILGAEKLNDYRKGLSDLIKVLGSVSEKFKNKVHLFVLGDGDSLSLNLPENFTIKKTGYVNDEVLYSEYLKASDIFLFPSKDDNLPVMPINSIACGTPVVAFDVGGCSDIIKDNYNGFLIEPFNLKEFSDKILVLLNNPEMLKTFSVNAGKFAQENFSINKMTNDYYNLFNEVISGFRKNSP